MAEIETLELQAAEERARLKLALEALGGSTRGAAMVAPLTDVAQAQAGKLGRGAAGAAQRNPTAAALVALGLGLFATGATARDSEDPQASADKDRIPDDTGHDALTTGVLALGAGALVAMLLPGRGR